MVASRGSNAPDSPWKKHFEAMVLVVPIRKMGKNLGLPLRVEDYGVEAIGSIIRLNYFVIFGLGIVEKALFGVFLVLLAYFVINWYKSSFV